MAREARLWRLECVSSCRVYRVLKGSPSISARRRHKRRVVAGLDAGGVATAWRHNSIVRWGRCLFCYRSFFSSTVSGNLSGQDHYERQHSTTASATSFVAPLGPLSVCRLDGMLSTPDALARRSRLVSWPSGAAALRKLCQLRRRSRRWSTPSIVWAMRATEANFGRVA